MSHANTVETPAGLGFVISLTNYGKPVEEKIKH